MTTQFRRTLDGAAAATAVAAAEPERYKRIGEWAREQSRKLELQALADMAVAAAEKATALAYEQIGGNYINLYPDGRVRFVPPWAKHSKTWPLSADQRELTRALIFGAARSFEKGSAPSPLYFFDEDRRRWVVNRGDYPTSASALTWLAWARQAWKAETVVTVLAWLDTHTADGRRRRGPQPGTAPGRKRALG